MNRATRRDAGSAIVDFVLVAGLVTLLFVGVVQLALVQHIRNTLTDCASEGARVGALADRGPADGAARTRELVRTSLAPRYAEDVEADDVVIDGIEMVEVRVTAPLPLVGLLGPGGALTVRGHAVRERP
ncbi:MAG TPA: TadE family protein [Cellulomonas sp.]|nr:TadE family protein [Cellulomonas sp.]